MTFFTSLDASFPRLFLQENTGVLNASTNTHPHLLSSDTLSSTRSSSTISAAYVLTSISKNAKHFDPSASLIEGSDPTNFKFASLDPETEKFLWRRKADLEIALRALDGMDALEGTTCLWYIFCCMWSVVFCLLSVGSTIRGLSHQFNKYHVYYSHCFKSLFRSH